MMPTTSNDNAWSRLSKAHFRIEEQDQLASLRQEFPAEPTDDEGRRRLDIGWDQFLKSIRIRVGTLLKTDSVSFLLGAGASKDAGGILIGALPLEIERDLLEMGVSGTKVRAWLKLFYVALRRLETGGDDVPQDRNAILARSNDLETAQPLKVNFEALLSLLYRWRVSLPQSGGRLRLDGTPPVNTTAKELDECLANAKKALVKRCSLPTGGDGSSALLSYRDFLKKLLTRPLNLKRANLFTLNYDTLVEQAADGDGVVLLDGFVGTVRRFFRPESYDQDLYFPADTTEGRVHRFDRVLHLYKLHGSITWRAVQPNWDNPYGVSITHEANAATGAPLIYPTPAKYGETLGMPYAELFRRFAAAVVRPQSTLFAIGYGFGDDHVNAIIRQALAIPSFTLIVVDPFAPDPDPVGGFLARLREQKDRRVWVVSGEVLGTFTAFVQNALPDLRDEEILRKVMATHRALAVEPDPPPVEDAANGN